MTMMIMGGGAAVPPSGNPDTLALTNLFSSGFDFMSPWFSESGIQVNTDGDVYERVSNTNWSAQNPTTEWIDGFTGSSASDYEVQLVKSTGTTPSGPALSTYHALSSTRTWTLTLNTSGSLSFTGTLTIREIADTSNSVSASVTLNCENSPF